MRRLLMSTERRPHSGTRSRICQGGIHRARPRATTPHAAGHLLHQPRRRGSAPPPPSRRACAQHGLEPAHSKAKQPWRRRETGERWDAMVGLSRQDEKTYTQEARKIVYNLYEKGLTKRKTGREQLNEVRPWRKSAAKSLCLLVASPSRRMSPPPSLRIAHAPVYRGGTFQASAAASQAPQAPRRARTLRSCADARQLSFLHAHRAYAPFQGCTCCRRGPIPDLTPPSRAEWRRCCARERERRHIERDFARHLPPISFPRPRPGSRVCH